MSPSRRPSPPFCMPRARSRSAAGDLAGPHQARAERLRIAADRRGHHAAALEADGARGLPQLGGDAQHPGLPAQVEQLEDVLDVQVLERSLERHGLARRGREDVLQVARGARARSGLRGVRARRVELHHPLPRLHGLVELPLPGEGRALVVERAGMLGVEPQHPLERLERLGRCGRPPAARGPAR